MMIMDYTKKNIKKVGWVERSGTHRTFPHFRVFYFWENP
ncbi:Uncharacterized protein dnm_074050 [Desulfonema magnum]|uniref:Uncharacterized protein n=1 Tax=Desulfonema magnum TaxID=45655 RepID=A0A975BTF2_9BACT|nr:Uncharacterized protein dnm_074050 [Desulfonema magnum]